MGNALRSSRLLSSLLSRYGSATLRVVSLMLIITGPLIAATDATELSSGCNWVEIPVAPIDWDATGQNPAFMTFDKSDGILTLLSFKYYETITIWKLIDGAWINVWNGDLDLPPNLYFGDVGNFYYDEILGSPMLLVDYSGPVIETCWQFLWRYVPGSGFVNPTNLPLCAERESFSVDYDNLRKREVFVGEFGYGMGVYPLSIEYDGIYYYIVPNTSSDVTDLIFEMGRSGYDPNTGHVVFFGQRYEEQPAETWEYNGKVWTLIQTINSPPMRNEAPIYGMFYVPALGGLLAIPNATNSMDTWIYRNHQWYILADSGKPDHNYFGLMAYDPIRHVPIYYDPGLIAYGHSNKLWELKCPSHIRPVAKP